MLGRNKRISIYRTDRTITATRSITEGRSLLFSNIRAAIQSHVLNNLPPPADRLQQSGIVYQREFRCWISCRDLPGTTPLTTWIVVDEATNEEFRVRAVVDDAGRGHHWLLRLENFGPPDDV